MSGERIRAPRQRLGLSQIELAAILGVSNVTVNRWENGRALPQAGTSERLLRIEQEGLDAPGDAEAGARGNLPAVFSPLVGAPPISMSYRRCSRPGRLLRSPDQRGQARPFWLSRPTA